jgi:hypothetical protein
LAKKFGHPGAASIKLQVGDIRIQHLQGKEIWHLVSKPWATQRKFSNPGAFYLNHLRALIALKDKVVERGATVIAITPLGNNCNRISWDFTAKKLIELFADTKTKIKFVVYCSSYDFTGVGSVAAEGTKSKETGAIPKTQTECLAVAKGVASGGCPKQPPTFPYHPPGMPTLPRYVNDDDTIPSGNSFPPPTQPDHGSPDLTKTRAYVEQYLKDANEEQMKYEATRKSRSPTERFLGDLTKRLERLKGDGSGLNQRPSGADLSKSLSGGGGKSLPPSPRAEHSHEPPQTNLLTEVILDTPNEVSVSPLISLAPEHDHPAPEHGTSAFDETQEERGGDDLTAAEKGVPDRLRKDDEYHQGSAAGGGGPNQLPPLDDQQPPRHAPTQRVSPCTPDRVVSSPSLLSSPELLAELRQMRRSLDNLAAKMNNVDGEELLPRANITCRKKKKTTEPSTPPPPPASQSESQIEQMCVKEKNLDMMKAADGK